MRMSPPKLIALRLYNVTIGRSPFFGRVLRQVLLRVLVVPGKNSYVQCSQYFSYDDLETEVNDCQ